MMHSRPGLRRSYGPLALLLLCSLLTGCDTAASGGASATATPAATATTVARPTPLPTRTAHLSVTGRWRFKDATTVEDLQLTQDKHGNVDGSGQSAVADSTPHKIDHSALAVQSGKVSGNHLTFSIAATQLDFGTGYTAIEYLSCTVQPTRLDCRMDLPLLSVKNVQQIFTRR